MLAVVGLAASVATAQTSWLAPASGSWFTPGNWTAGVPNGGTAATLGLVGPYTVTLQNANGATSALTISNSAATLSVFDNSQLDVGGTISNAGLIQISGPGAPGNSTRLAVAAPNVTHQGGGTIRLAALGNGDNDTAYITNQAGAHLTNAAFSTIAGAGRIYTPFTNNGTINADQNGKGLFLQLFHKTNNATVTASNGGFVQLRTSLTQGPSGVLLSSNNSPIQINNSNAVVTGGTLNGAGTNSGIQYFGVATLDAVTLQGANMVMDNTQVNVEPGGVINNGTWSVSSPTAPGNATRISSGIVPTTVSGTGTIRLQGIQGGNGDNDTAYLTYGAASASLTNASTHSIRGYGRIYTPLTNEGTVNADVAGKGIFMIDRPKFNNGTMTASNGGVLQFRGITVTGSPSAQVISTDAASPVQMVNATMTGGGFTTSGTGLFQYFGVNTLSNLTVNGTHQIEDNTLVRISTNLVNNGNWLISKPTAPGNATRMSADAAAVTISGTGTIRLQGIQGGNGDNDTAYLTYEVAPNALTLGANQQLLGYGRIYTNLVNNGTANADVAGKGLLFIDQPKTNNGTITASNGGFVQFRGVTVTGNPTAQVISTDAASPVQMVNASMTGGGFTTSGTGLFQYFGSNTLSNLTVNGTHQIEDNTLVTLATNLVNNGTWLISKPTAPGNFTRVAAGANVSITGNGTIRLQGIQGGNGDNDTAYLTYTSPANALTLGTNQQLRGYGRVYTNIVNNGTIHADNTPNASGPASKGIILMDQPKTNNATITSSNGGFWYVRGITLTNGPSGVMSSTNTTTSGGGFENCTVNGGTLTNTGTQPFGTVGTTNLNSVTITPGSTIQINDNSNMQTTGLTNDGEINIQKIGNPGNATRLTASANNATIAGTGTVRLNSVNNSANNDTAFLQTSDPANFTGVFGPNQTLAGIGRVHHKWLFNGTISPGQGATASGEIQCNGGSVTLSPSAKLIVHANGTPASSNFDRVTGNSSKAIAGMLNFTFEGAYTPAGNELYDIVTTGANGLTGEFDSVSIEPLSPTGPAHVVYLSDRVRVVMCKADCDANGTLNVFDYICFGQAYSAQAQYADCDNNGLFNIFDYICFGSKYSVGCP